MRVVVTLLALALPGVALHTQAIDSSTVQHYLQPDPPHHNWQASWITHPTAPLREPVVLHFRHTLTLAAVPANYLVRVSADNRFILFVNGHRVGDGPARGHLTPQPYERLHPSAPAEPGRA